MTTQVMQEVLHDKSATGRERPWKEHKINSGYLAMAYDSFDEKKAERIRGCAPELSFRVSEEGMRLAHAWFCRARLCPVCSWRRSLKVGAQMHQIMEEIAKRELKLRYVLLTLTMRNVPGEELSEALDELNAGFKRLSERKQVRDVAKGWYKAIEVTHNLETDEFHPHIHTLIAVAPGYFSGKSYIRQDEWTSLWQDALRAPYVPIVDVRAVKGNTAAAVAEVAKYAVKSGDYIVPDDWELTERTVQLLDRVLGHRRFLGYGGIFKEIAKDLKLKDVEKDDDLIHVDGEATSDAQDKLVTFVWYSGYRQYIRASEPI